MSSDNNINKQIVETDTFKKYNHNKLNFGKEQYEVAICEYGNNKCEVQMIFQFNTRSKNIEEYYDVNSKMTFEQVEDKPLFVRQALAYAMAIELAVNRELRDNINK